MTAANTNAIMTRFIKSVASTYVLPLPCFTPGSFTSVLSTPAGNVLNLPNVTTPNALNLFIDVLRSSSHANGISKQPYTSTRIPASASSVCMKLLKLKSFNDFVFSCNVAKSFFSLSLRALASLKLSVTFFSVSFAFFLASSSSAAPYPSARRPPV